MRLHLHHCSMDLPKEDGKEAEDANQGVYAQEGVGCTQWRVARALEETLREARQVGRRDGAQS